MKRYLVGVATAVCLVGVHLASAGSAQAADTPPPPAPLITKATVVVEDYTPDFKKLVSKQTYGQETEGKLMPAPTDSPSGSVAAMSSGSGGTSSASGCRKVTVNHEAETVLGFTAYWFKTWTNWCWNRSTQVVSSVSTNWYITDVDSQQYWRGIVNDEFLFYDYSTNDGHPRSAYKHYRQGRFENCVLKYGCIGTTYPANTLRSYYNGTWAWETNG